MHLASAGRSGRRAQESQEGLVQLRRHNSMAEHSLRVSAHLCLEQEGAEDTQCSFRNLHTRVSLKQQPVDIPVTAGKHREAHKQETLVCFGAMPAALGALPSGRRRHSSRL